MNLLVLIDGNHPDHRLAVLIASQEHGPKPDTIRVARVRQRRPPQAVVVLGVQVR